MYDALLSVADNATTVGTSGTKSHAEPPTIAGQMLTFTFLCSFVVWHCILSEVNRARKTLQAVEFYLHQVIKQLAILRDSLRNYCSDYNFASVPAAA